MTELDQSYEDYLSDEPNQYGLLDGLTKEEYDELIRTRRAAPSPWHRDEPMTGGTVGGDGAYEAMSVRWRRDDKPNAVIDAYYYVVDERDRRSEDDIIGTLYETRPFHVEDMTIFTICDDPDDPGGTELWSEIEYGEGSVFAYETEEQAERERDNMLAHYEQPGNYLWDGETRR